MGGGTKSGKWWIPITSADNNFCWGNHIRRENNERKRESKRGKESRKEKKVWSTCPPRGTRIFDRLSHEHQIQKGLRQKKQRTTREHKEREVKNMTWTYRLPTKMTKFWLSTRGRIFVRTRKKETEREQRAACMGVGVGVCVCFVLLIGNLEKKPRSWQRSRWKGEEEKTRKGHCLRTQRCHAFSRKGWGCWFPPINFLLFYFLMNDFFFSCTTITQDSYHSIHSKMGSHL